MGVCEHRHRRAVRAILPPAERAVFGIRHREDSGAQRAFTLIELLVVVAVLAVLASITLPAVARARSSGKSTVCANNLRQWGLATHSYASEHDDFLPPDGSPNGNSTKSGWYINLPETLSSSDNNRNTSK